MTEIQIRKYKELSSLKDAYEDFIKKDGNVAIVQYSTFLKGFIHYGIKDEEFKEMVKNIAKERLENINKQIEKL